MRGRRDFLGFSLGSLGCAIEASALATGTWYLGEEAASTFFAPNIAKAEEDSGILLETLMEKSQTVILGTAEESESHWEIYGGSRRIVTYTRIRREQVLDGRDLGDTDNWVMTLGGSSGKLAQWVPGEAQLPKKQSMVLFLHQFNGSTFGVTGRAQGCFSAKKEKNELRIASGVNSQEFSANSAVRRLHGLKLCDCERLLFDLAESARKR